MTRFQNRIGEITLEQKFDAALASAAGWYADARLYSGPRRQSRLDHAHRMERIAAQIVEAA